MPSFGAVSELPVSTVGVSGGPHPVGRLTQSHYGLSGRRYGSFLGKFAVDPFPMHLTVTPTPDFTMEVEPTGILTMEVEPTPTLRLTVTP